MSAHEQGPTGASDSARVGPVQAGVHLFAVAPSFLFVFWYFSAFAFDWLTSFVYSFSPVLDFRKKVKYLTITLHLVFGNRKSVADRLHGRAENK